MFLQADKVTRTEVFFASFRNSYIIDQFYPNTSLIQKQNI